MRKRRRKCGECTKFINGCGVDTYFKAEPGPCFKPAMNLYWVHEKNELSAGVFVFAETRNDAKNQAAQYVGSHWWECGYFDMRNKRIKKDVGGYPEVCDNDCERLEALGVRYMTEDEINHAECEGM